MRLIPELRQLEIGISTKRYLPAIGTAGFERCAVKGIAVDLLNHPQICLAENIFAQMMIAGDAVNVAIQRVAEASHHLTVGRIVVRLQTVDEFSISHRAYL